MESLHELQIHKAEPHRGSASFCRHCDRAIRRVPGGSGPVWVHDDGHVVAHGAPKPNTRLMLDLSTGHVPVEWSGKGPGYDTLEAAPGVVAYANQHGWLMWVPDDPEYSSKDDPDGPVPPEILKIQVYARAHGCDYVLFDEGADTDPELPTWDW